MRFGRNRNASDFNEAKETETPTLLKASIAIATDCLGTLVILFCHVQQ